MKMTWLGHSAFRIETGAAKILISRYREGKNSKQEGDR
jgi:L-ascorbate metabolism protein UlaG (beta-lactamase superfamily)